jgi:hypothetical protein
MPAIKRTPDELARLGKEIVERQVSPALEPPDDGKFIAIDVDSHDYEVNEDDHAAIAPVRQNDPGSGARRFSFLYAQELSALPIFGM